MRRGTHLYSCPNSENTWQAIPPNSASISSQLLGFVNMLPASILSASAYLMGWKDNQQLIISHRKWRGLPFLEERGRQQGEKGGRKGLGGGKQGGRERSQTGSQWGYLSLPKLILSSWQGVKIQDLTPCLSYTQTWWWYREVITDGRKELKSLIFCKHNVTHQSEWEHVLGPRQMAFFLQMVHYMNKISETRSRVAATVLADIKYHRQICWKSL